MRYLFWPLLLISAAAGADRGQPVIHRYQPRDVSSNAQVWSILQDRRGVMFFAVSGGFFEFDGERWHKITANTAGRSLAQGADGRIWAGTNNDFGSLEPDAKGALQYVSLAVPAEVSQITAVWQVLPTAQGVFFRTYETLFRWDGKRMHYWRSKTRFEALSEVRGKLYTAQGGIGLQEIVGDELRPVPGGEAYAKSPKLFLHPWTEGRVLISSRGQPLTIWDGQRTAPFPTEADAYLAKNSSYFSTLLPGGSLCVTTMLGGAVVLDSQGRQRHLIEQGLPQLNTLAATLDREGALWLGTGNGIARAEIQSPVTIVSDDGANRPQTHEGTVWVPSSGSNKSVFSKVVRDPATGLSTLQPVPVKPMQLNVLRSFQDQLLAATLLGVQVLKGNQLVPAVAGLEGVREVANNILFSRRNPNRLFVGHGSGGGGVSSLRWDGRQWINEGRVPGLAASRNGAAEDDDGNFWAGFGEGALRIRVPDAGGMGQATFTLLGEAQGLPKNGSTTAARLGPDVYVWSVYNEGPFMRWDRSSQKFVPDTRFQLAVSGARRLSDAFELENGDIWAFSQSLTEQRQGLFRKQSDGRYQLEEAPYRLLSRYSLSGVHRAPDGALWLGGEKLLHFDPTRASSLELPPLTTLIRQITNGAGEVLYGGAGATTLTLPPGTDSLSFEFAANAFGGESETSYQYRLEGADRNWSAWVRQAQARYSGLGPGVYRFHVRGKAMDGRESAEATFSVTITPPWYRSPFAYGSYALMFFGSLFGARRWTVAHERAKAARQTAALEATVAERTKEIATQRDSINLLNEIGKEITASLDLETILFKLYERVNQITDASIFGVGLYRPEQNAIEYTLAIENGKRYAPYMRSTLDKDQLPVWCIDHRRPVMINDVSVETNRYIQKYEHKARFLEDGTRAQAPQSMIYLPLVAQDRVLGVLSVQSFQKNAYDEQDLSLLENLAAYTTIALDNAGAYGVINQRAAEMATMNRISQALSSQLDPAALVQLVGEQVRDVFHAPIAYVALLDRATMTLHFPYSHGQDSPSRPFGGGITSRIIRTGEPLLINQDLDGARERLGIEQMGKRAASYLGVPIVSGGETVGVISVQSTEVENRFNENDQRLLATIASAVGVALHNARLFEETRQAKAAAEEADAAKSSFLSTVSHELRTPLTSVLGFAKIIRRRLEERLFPLIPEDDRKIAQAKTQVVENLGVVVSEGERLTKLIDDVLDLAKIEAGKFTWNMERLEIGEVIDRALSATASLFEAKKLTVVREVAEGLPPLTGDRDRLIQVVINLISNAVKFTDAGSVKCAARLRPDGLMEVAVVDSGIGIAPADQPKVFEKFKQVGDTLTDKPKGTGLGLPICKEIVEYHGGRIWVESTPGAGSTFAFTLPCEGSGPQPLDIESLVRRLKETVATRPPQSKSILVVDDDPHIRTLLQQEFTEAGYAVRLAEDGRRALQMVREEKPGLVVLDVMMPEMNGFDVAAVLKNDPVTMDIPIIILSIVEDKERGFRLGVDRYLTKPIDTPLLFHEVDALLGQGKSRRKVMVVDEDTSTLRTLTDVLQTRGYQVVEANGAELVAKAVTNKPDIIILSSLVSNNQEAVRTLRFEKGLENVLFLIYR